MKEVIRIEDSLTNKISYYHVIVFMACLPFDRFYSELVLISFLIHELIHLNKEKLTSSRLPVLLPVALYLVTLLSSLYTLDKGQMHKDLEKQLALVLFPLIFSVTSLDVKKIPGPPAEDFWRVDANDSGVPVLRRFQDYPV